MALVRKFLVTLYRLTYRYGVRPVLFRTSSAQDAHEKILNLLIRLDNRPRVQTLLRRVQYISMPSEPLMVGGVMLDRPLILAAGFVKGLGFPSEEEALEAVEHGENIIPGWQTMASLVGAVELGSITRWPRVGNSGTVIWRDVPTESTQNRVGLKNPGAKAATAFLSQHPLSPQMGINIAVSPGILDPDQEEQEVVEILTMLSDQGVKPAWLTLNLSCPNTEDDPSGNQSEAKVMRLCGAAQTLLESQGIPLWVKIGPDLANNQYQLLMRAFADVNVKAVIATNTLGQQAPQHALGVMAGIGGGRLYPHALSVARLLVEQRQQHGYPVDVIGCGGVMNATSYRAYRECGVSAIQYWSALVYQGPLAPAVILS